MGRAEQKRPCRYSRARGGKAGREEVGRSAATGSYARKPLQPTRGPTPRWWLHACQPAPRPHPPAADAWRSARIGDGRPGRRPDPPWWVSVAAAPTINAVGCTVGARWPRDGDAAAGTFTPSPAVPHGGRPHPSSATKRPAAGPARQPPPRRAGGEVKAELVSVPEFRADSGNPGRVGVCHSAVPPRRACSSVWRHALGSVPFRPDRPRDPKRTCVVLRQAHARSASARGQQPCQPADRLVLFRLITQYFLPKTSLLNK
jgi:hypothetical protein